MKRSLLVALLFGIAGPVWAALPPLTPKERSDSAEVILTGEVLVSRIMIHRKPSSSVYVVRLGVQIDSIEKGKDLLPDTKTIEIRCWTMRKTNMPGPGGHYSIPADGSQFRTWLRQNEEGQWEPLEPNGFELLDGSPSLTFAATEKRERGKGILLGGIAGLLALGLLVWFRLGK